MVALRLLPLLCLVTILAPAANTSAAPSAQTPVARITRDFAAVLAGPGPEHALVWKLYEGSQVAVLGEAPGADGAIWRKIRLWNAHDGWLPADATTFEPYPPPRPAQGGGGTGPCQPKPAPRAQGPFPLGASARLDGQPALAESWAVGDDGLVRYRLVGPEGQANWAPPGAAALASADPATRLVSGRPIAEPLRGVGLWFVPDSREYGLQPGALVAQAARANGLSHLYVEVATSKGGFWGNRWLDDLLPVARAAGVAVIGSLYACLDDLPADLALARDVAAYRTPGGLGLDGLTVDLEETLVAPNLAAFGDLLRHSLGDDYLLVATTYPPESYAAPRYPWPALARSWNVIAPMAYWRQMEERPFTPNETYTYTRRNLAKLRSLTNRPDLQVEMLGQLFEMNRPRLLGPDPPTAAEVEAAARGARDEGAVGISYFDWTRATPAHWAALAGLKAMGE